ncbi:MAG: hypothetical protein IJJ33_00670 [Victivallales bacterium]|nr:hypothetical protein [Victivallales bacterium]
MSRKEGGKIFGSGSRTPIAITILVKKPNAKGTVNIFYHDIGDYLSREEKLKIIKEFGSICNPCMNLSSIAPNQDNDWLNQSDGLFETFITIGDKDNKFTNTVFVPYYSRGCASARDAWVYNFGRQALDRNISSMIAIYNEHVERFKNTSDKSIMYLSSKISWSGTLEERAKKMIPIEYHQNQLTEAMYRPFCKQVFYYDKSVLERTYQMPRIFPTPQSTNLVICCAGVGVTKEFSCIITNIIPDLELIGKSQCFPLYYYEKQETQQQGEFDFGDGGASVDGYIRHDGISDFILKRGRELNPKVTKEDIFFYVYGLLHSPDYRQRFSADLKKSLPHIPLPENYATFKIFQNIGRKLADIHLNYETYPMTENVLVQGESTRHYRVEKMRFVSKDDKRTIIFNDFIQIENVPLKAYDYVLNGKSAIEWIMERYAISTDKASGIVNDPNQWSENPRYILELLLRIIQVSVDTVDLVSQLPHWEF